MTRIPVFAKLGLSMALLACQLLFACQSSQAANAPEYPKDIAARLQARYDAMTSLSFDFNQRTEGQVSGRPQSGSGQAFFLKQPSPSRLRWNYTAPSRQVLVSDGKTFSMYFEDLKQMVVSPAKELDNELTYSFFSGTGNLDRDFHILPPNEEFISQDQPGEAAKIIKLVPKAQQSQVQYIHLWVSADSLIQRIEIRDHFDTLTRLTLSNITVNPLAGKSAAAVEELFSFVPPEGTEILHQ